jgi:AraC family transcriptional activator of mtrCDE
VYLSAYRNTLEFLVDLLGDILSTLELRSSLYFRAELTAPYSIAVPEDRNVIRFHVANEGPCRIELPSGESTDFFAGDLVLVPHGAAHVLSDSAAMKPVPLCNVLDEAGFDGTGPLVFGGGGNKTVIVCGYFAFGQEIMHPVIASLPRLVHVQGCGGRHYAWLEQLLAYMDAESKTCADAWAEVTTRVAEILFIYTLREYVRMHPNSAGALMALSDHRIAKSLQAVHADPSAEWSLDRLAERAAMSKTTFSETFRRMMGVTPMNYVVSWRMHKARALIARSERTIQAIALEVGYDSESAFSRVFKEHFGAPPGRFRRSLASDAEERDVT